MYRPKGYICEERKKKKDLKRTSWYKPFDSVLFCPPTPGGMLARQLREVAERSYNKMLIRIKVVEKAGISLKQLLPGLREKKECTNIREKCFIHKNDGIGNCRQESVVYQSTCTECKKKGVRSIYTGETCRTGFYRGKQHMEAIDDPGNHKDNGFAKHILEYHTGKKNISFKTSIIGTFKRPMERQICEGVNIYQCKNKNKCDILINSKMDFYQPAVSRVTISNNLD